VAFHAGNLEAVATALRDAHPGARIIIAGDNDHHRPRETGPDGRPKPNVGRIAAEKAAAAVGGFALLPAFASDDRGTDWNDLAAKSAEAFIRQWRDGMAAAGRHFEAGKIGAARTVARYDTQQTEGVRINLTH
jgi:putative DNA primase/helicase